MEDLELAYSGDVACNMAYRSTEAEGMVGEVESLFGILARIWVLKYGNEIIIEYFLGSCWSLQISYNFHTPKLITISIPHASLTDPTLQILVFFLNNLQTFLGLMMLDELRKRSRINVPIIKKINFIKHRIQTAQF